MGEIKTIRKWSDEEYANRGVIREWSDEEYANRKDLHELFEATPIPSDEILQNLGLYLNRQSLSRILFMQYLYEKIVNINGVIMEFGVRWGQNLALFESFRGIYEPYNYTRNIVGFDTFEGFKSIDEKDGDAPIIKDGAYAVSENYEDYLSKVLDCHEKESPVNHIKKYQLIKGDATQTIHDYLGNNTQTIIALAYFDFDIYKPTKECLEAILPYLTKGSIIGFDELNHKQFPGETIALREVKGLSKYSVRRSPTSARQSYIIIE